jgi:mono/diheme cytochrome c family protein
MAMLGRATLNLTVRGLAIGVLLLSAAPAFAAGDAPAVSGQALAKEACSACHQVAPGQVHPPLVANPDEGSKISAPSFMEIAKLCLAEGDLHAKITNPHYPMREQLLTPVDVDALSRYIRSLAPGAPCPLPAH